MIIPPSVSIRDREIAAPHLTELPSVVVGVEQKRELVG